MKRFYRILSSVDYACTCKMANDGVNALIMLPAFLKKANVKGIVYCVDETQAFQFEKILNEYSVSFKTLDLEDAYLAYKKECESSASSDDLVVITEAESEDACYVLPNGQLRLHEAQVAYKNRIKLYCESNERCEHNIPHVHLSINGCLNICSLAIVDQSLLAFGKGFMKNKQGKYVELLRENKEKAKEVWNSCHNLCKFKTLQDGTLSDEYSSKAGDHR